MLKYLSFFLLAVLVYFIFYKPIEHNDIWWHLSVGRWIFENKTFADFDIFSPRGQPSPWILTQSIGSCVYYLVYLLGDLPGLKVFRLILFCTVLGLFLFHNIKKLPPELCIFLIFLLCYPLASRSFLRPLAFNFIFIQIYLIILFAYENNPQNKKIFILPLLSILWMNLHLGGFIYGSALIGMFLLASAIRVLNVTFDPAVKGEDRRRQQSSFIELLSVFAGHLFALLVNPFGLSGAAYPFKAVFNKNFIINKHLTTNILELLPPVYIFSWRGAWVHLLILMTVIVIFKSKRKNITHLLLFIFSLFLFLYSHRACVFFALCCVYIITDAFKDLPENMIRRGLNDTAAKRMTVYIVLSLIFSAHILHYHNTMIFADDRLTRKSRSLFDPYTPQKQLEIMQKNGLTGNIFNLASYGGYLIFNAYPEIRPFSDSRQADPKLYEQYLNILKDPPRYWPEAQKRYNFRMALLDGTVNSQHRILSYLINDPGWQIINTDGSSVLLVKSGTYDLPAQLLNYDQALDTLNRKSLTVKSPPQSASTSIVTKLMDFIGPEITYNKNLEEGMVLLMHNYPMAGLSKIAEINEQIQDKRARFYLNLAISHVNEISKSPEIHDQNSSL